MSVSANGFAKTEKASRYLQQLCKHWEHNLKVEFTADHGTIVFPKDARGADWPGDGLVTLDAKPDGLAIRVDASADGQLEGRSSGMSTGSRSVRRRWRTSGGDAESSPARGRWRAQRDGGGGLPTIVLASAPSVSQG